LKLNKKGENKMEIEKMRSRLETRFAKIGGFPDTAPDWVVRGVYEKSEGLPLTPLPIGVRRMTETLAELRSVVNQTNQATAKTVGSPASAEAEFDALQRRVWNLTR
jgi:hypothetical protein